MRKLSYKAGKYALVLFICAFALFLVNWGGNSLFPGQNSINAEVFRGSIPLNKANPAVQAVMAVQGRHIPGLMAIPDVVGTATGLDEAGQLAILVFTKRMVGAGVIPERLEGIPVVVQVTGEIFALKPPSGGGTGKGKPQPGVDPTAWFASPVPIGVSTGNAGECSAGTIGARVTDGANVYALSNNHVYALENLASPEDEVLQPGLYDTDCAYNPDYVLGVLKAFVPIDFTGADNEIDAAIALSSIDNLDNATPSNGYGRPMSATVLSSIGQPVQKYGRTTSLTKGKISGINATFNITYSAGTARFINQILVSSNKPFIKAGDSGSLLVTDSGRNPVGLLFAGSLSGKMALANPIDSVLLSFNVTIDGE